MANERKNTMPHKFDAPTVFKMLEDSMENFRGKMIGLVRECADSDLYANLNGREALLKMADKLERINNNKPL